MRSALGCRFFFFQAEDGIRDLTVTGVQTCALPIYAAVQSARTCFDSPDWQGLSPRKRGGLLFRLADLLEQRAKDFAELETRNNGKPLFESRIDVAMAVQTYRYYAGWADKLTGDTLPVDGPFFAYTLRE